MKMLKLVLLLPFILLPSLRAQEARFFRVVGPVATTIRAFNADGYITWTNELTNTTFTVQAAQSLLGPSNWVDYIQVPVTNPVTTHRLYDPNPPPNMVLIPAGSFTMGNCLDPGEGWDDELPWHTVYVSAFYMDKYEVTKALWDEVYQWATNRPIAVRYSFDYSNSGQGKTNDHPAHSMTWYDAVKWCNARSEKEGRTPAYYKDAGLSMRYRSGQVSPYVNWSSGYRLPTEAEWEKAARGGASGKRFPWSDADSISHSRANYNSYWCDGVPFFPYDANPAEGCHPAFNDGVPPYTGPVGYFAANGYGVYGMAGNLWEWCWDWYQGDWYSQDGATQDDTRGPVGSFSHRVVRGGDWSAYADSARCAIRNVNVPDFASNALGFRGVRGL